MFTERYKNLNVFNSVKSKLFSGSYVLTPKNPDHDKLGRLYVIVELSLDNNLASKITEIILEVLQKEYYRLDEFFKEDLILRNFEKTLNKTNQALSTLASEGYTDWIDNTHIAIAAIKNNKIHFALAGNPKIFLVRGDNFISIGQNSGSQASSPMKTFTNITSGTLMPDDNIFLTTPELMKFVSEEKIKKLILANKSEVLEYIKHEIPTTDDYSFAALSINIEKDENKYNQPSLKKPSIQSPKKLDYPSLNELESLSQHKKYSLANEKKEQNHSTTQPKIPIKSNKNPLDKVKSFGLGIVQKTKSFKKNISQRGQRDRTQKLSRSGLNLKKLPQFLAHKFNDLPKSSKILLVLSVTLALLFGSSLILLKQRKNEINKLSQHEIILNSALNKEQEARNALIYKDKDKAKELLLQAQAEADKLISADIMVAEAQNLLDAISEQMDKVEGVTRVNDPLLLANLKEINSDSIFGSNDAVFTFDKNKNFIYKLNEENKILEKISEESTNIGYFTQAAINETKNSIIFMTDSPSFVEFLPSSRALNNLEVDLLSDDEETADIKIYSDRLYRLIPSQKQILRHTRTIAGYSKGVEWALSNTSELDNAISFAIDGEVYVLKTDGKIIKYLRGIKQEFNLQTARNPLESPTKIYTSDSLDNIYIIEPKQKRVLLYAKNSGSLLIQYTSDKFSDLKDVYVDEKEQKLYILSDDNIYGIVMNLDNL
jgi:hypothetical protein